jgi:tRNA G46 methylase TrmB
MSTSNSRISAYEEVLYPGVIFPQTHPDRLSTIGTLRGMRPVSINYCRILELACSIGNNLIAMAAHLSGSELVGVGLAKNAITAGQAVIAELGLENIRLHHLDVCDLSRTGFGQFDYIIAHGLYSWVPAP